MHFFKMVMQKFRIVMPKFQIVMQNDPPFMSKEISRIQTS